MKEIKRAITDTDYTKMVSAMHYQFGITSVSPDEYRAVMRNEAITAEEKAQEQKQR